MTLDLKGSVAVNDPRLDMARGSVSAAAGLPIPTARVRGSADATNPKAAASTGRDGTAVASDFNTVSAAQLNGRFNSGDRPAKTLAAETCYSASVARKEGGVAQTAPPGGSATEAVHYSRRGPICRRGHPWSANEVRRPDGRRQCRTCRNYRARRANWARQGFVL